MFVIDATFVGALENLWPKFWLFGSPVSLDSHDFTRKVVQTEFAITLQNIGKNFYLRTTRTPWTEGKEQNSSSSSLWFENSELMSTIFRSLYTKKRSSNDLPSWVSLRRCVRGSARRTWILISPPDNCVEIIISVLSLLTITSPDKRFHKV